ncbi:lipid A deacylase LpxR family protein [Hyphomonadaceae bacterium ML37]|nr:lipid A deacylase LpxR family protein [Hyphomonadaceae bacterium ML37]
MFGGIAGTWVGRDIFLDGNTFRSSRSVDKHDVVWSAQAGIAVQWEHVRVSYTHIVRSDQFTTQREQHRFGSFSISVVR